MNWIRDQISKYINIVAPIMVAILLILGLMLFKSCSYSSKLNDYKEEIAKQQQKIAEIEKQQKTIQENEKLYPVIDNKVDSLTSNINNINKKISSIKDVNKKEIDDEVNSTNLNDLSNKFRNAGYDNTVICR